MFARGRAGAGAAALFIAPVVLLAGLAAHPFVHSYLDSSVIAGAVAGAPGRWASSHQIIVFGLGLLLVAVMVIRRELRAAGEQRWSVVALPLLLAGGTLPAAATGSEPDPVTRATVGGDHCPRRCRRRAVRPPDHGGVRLRRCPGRGQLADRLPRARREDPDSHRTCPTGPRAGVTATAPAVQGPAAGRPTRGKGAEEAPTPQVSGLSLALNT
jgi:hypothetical protein